MEKAATYSSNVISLEKGKLPPQAVDLEEVILGAMMIDAKGVDDCLSVIQHANIFYKEAHQKIFEAIYVLWEKALPIDLLTVSEQLKKQAALEITGGEFYLIQLTQKVSSAAHMEYHCRIVLQKYISRELIAVGNYLSEKGYDSTMDVLDLMDEAEKRFTNVSEIIFKGKTEMSWSQALREVAKRVEFLTNNEGDLTGVPTGFMKLDKFFGGWQRTDFVVIGARPGMGKTALIVRNMIEAAKQGYKVGFVSMEMSIIQLATRGIAVDGPYHMKQLNQTGFEHSKYFVGLNKLIDEMQGLPIFIDDRPSLTIGDIKSKARSWKRKHGLDILFVDYIQLTGGTTDIRIRTGETSRGCKHIAKELEIPVIGLSQLTREVEKTPHKRPALHHLKEAGDIEQDADIVAFIYRADYYGLEVDENILDPDENTEFIVAKNRNGGVGTEGLWFEGNKTKFYDKNPFNNYPGNVSEDSDDGIDF